MRVHHCVHLEVEHQRKLTALQTSLSGVCSRSRLSFHIAHKCPEYVILHLRYTSTGPQVSAWLCCCISIIILLLSCCHLLYGVNTSLCKWKEASWVYMQLMHMKIQMSCSMSRHWKWELIKKVFFYCNTLYITHQRSWDTWSPEKFHWSVPLLSHSSKIT